MNSHLFSKFVEYSKEEIRSGDMDPDYPVMREVCANVPDHIKIWRIGCYMAFVHLGSGEKVWREFPEPTIITKPLLYECATERRGFRGNNPELVKHLNQFAKQMIVDPDYYVDAARLGGVKGWNELGRRIRLIKYNGPWAAYKWGDFVKWVLGIPITAPDFGIGGGSVTTGPVAGLRLIMDWQPQEALSINNQKCFYQMCLDAGIPLNGMEELETLLCDFSHLYHGQYYPGNDIDCMMPELNCDSPMWEARKDVFPLEYLGELHGWHGIRKAERKKAQDWVRRRTDPSILTN